ncbi:uncharacterized protein A4U43_C08F24860 [Asparagus officinalis]|nr:uncharacterized protein A4U43_C08F24860 [Asparagus officinalis]
MLPARPTYHRFRLPPPPSTIRIRRAAHLVDKSYTAKYARAVELMKALPADDPRSFYQQANVHCAYCDGAYQQVGFPNLEIQVHRCWLFAPFHRWYLYFHERILRKLIGDESFALPFWNWDNPRGGMRMPALYLDSSLSLYDEFRNEKHLPPTVIDLNYDGMDKNVSDEVLIDQNLKVTKS